MREWVPVSGSAKGRLALTAARAFGARPFDEVTVGALAAAAGVTTGALYHHFGSKLGLYAFVRADVERRLLDRMEGAVSASVFAPDRADVVTAALLAGFDYAVRAGFAQLLGAPPVDGDRLADLLGELTEAMAGRVLAAAWRAAVLAAGDDVEPARRVLSALSVRFP